MHDNLDIISSLAELAFASRLRRLSDRLMKDVTQIYKNLDLDFEARWFSILFALNLRSPLKISILAYTLRLTHTAVIQLADEMINRGLVQSARGEEDERERLLSLTNKGKEIITVLTPVWEEIQLATRELIQSSGCDILSALQKIEADLDEKEMYERVWLRLKGKHPYEITLQEYTPAMKKHFKILNYEWLNEYFEVEESDEKVLADPNNKIIRQGGYILFALSAGQVIGTCALIRHNTGTFELAKMAVTKKFRGRGVGRLLLDGVLDKARSAGIKHIYLQTSPVLVSANYLYEKAGFRKTSARPFGKITYERPTIMMKLDL